MVTFIRNIWIQWVRVHAHVQDMVHLFHIVWSIFRKESSGYIQHHQNNSITDGANRQINMDYAICQALKRFPQHAQVLIIYDICCQWIIHFRQRVSESEFLDLWDSLEITGAVGKWHLAAHIVECFPKFSLNFVEGAGEVDGKILETLWSGMDEIAGLTQAMSISHCQEVQDDYMNDSNWRKMIRMGRNLHDTHHPTQLT
jgi:hypothetical protein